MKPCLEGGYIAAMRVQANGNGNGNGAMANGASSNGSSALSEEDSTGVRRLLKLLKVST